MAGGLAGSMDGGGWRRPAGVLPCLTAGAMRHCRLSPAGRQAEVQMLTTKPRTAC